MALDLRRLFKKEKQEHRILRQIERGDHLQPEYHRATPECPHPERWSMFDSMTAEVEVLEFLRFGFIGSRTAGGQGRGRPRGLGRNALGGDAWNKRCGETQDHCRRKPGNTHLTSF